MGPPNKLTGKAASNTQTMMFECPRMCGMVDMTLAELEKHIKDECDLREFEKKQDLYDQCHKL